MTLYRDIVGSAAWDALPHVLHDLHEHGGEGTFTVISRGVARVASALGLAPSAGTVPLTLTIEKTDAGGERWIRNFRGEVFATEQRPVRGLISERYGVIELQFKASAHGTTLRYDVLLIRLLGLTLPVWMRPRIDVTERADGPRVQVNVMVGKSFRYTGFIVPR